MENWEGLPGGNAKSRQAAACAALPLPVSQAKPTEEGESRGTEGESTAQPFYATVGPAFAEQKMMYKIAHLSARLHSSLVNT